MPKHETLGSVTTTALSTIHDADLISEYVQLKLLRPDRQTAAYLPEDCPCAG